MQKDDYRAEYDFPTKLAPTMDSNRKMIQTLAQREFECSNSYLISDQGASRKCFSQGRTQHQSFEDDKTYSRLNRLVKVDDGQQIPEREKHLDKKQVSIAASKIYKPHPIQSRTKEQEEHPRQKLVRVGGRLMVIADKRDFEEIAASKWTDTKYSLAPNPQIESLSKTGKSFQPSQMNHTHPSARLLSRPKAGTANASFVAPTTSCNVEETAVVPLQAPNKEYDTRARDEQRQGRMGVYVFKNNDADKTRRRRVGVCPATDTTRKDRTFSRVVLKRF